MIVIGIDPGPEKCGVVLYDSEHRFVPAAWSAVSVEDVLGMLIKIDRATTEMLVAIERVQSTGQSGADLFRTCEVVGRLQQRALDSGLRVVLLYRREVCSALHVYGSGKDAQVRQAMIEAHGGTKAAAVGTKKEPGPLLGVSGHAWQALGLAYVAAEVSDAR